MEYVRYAQSVLELDAMLEPLRLLAESCGVPSPERCAWYQLLKQKLIPQINETPFLIVAVMGGTNTGKSLVFNHLAGEPFSAVDDRASGTKHPVCLVPKTAGTVSFEHILRRQFSAFRPVLWSKQEEPLQAADENLLFFCESKNVPGRLMLLDTPDFDADREVNWKRAEAVRHAADVVIAVLTEQKYNDAAVRQFFREAAVSGKPLLVLFNMIDVAGDLPHLARWLDRFRNETGAEPVDVLAAPFDKEKAGKLQLPFYAVRDGQALPVDLKTELNDLHFDTIKTQTLLGAVKILDDPKTGVRSYLDAAESASKQFAEAAATLQNIGGTQIQWAGLPPTMLADEIRMWWDKRRPNWSQNINAVYRKIGKTLLWSVHKAADFVIRKEPSAASPDDFLSAEHRSAIEFVEKIIGKLTALADTENPVLRREITELTDGKHRESLLRRAHQVLEKMPPVDREFRELLHGRLTEWTAHNPAAAAWMQTLDTIATAARPLITVTLAVSGFAAGAHVLGQMLGEAAMASGITAGGEAAIYAGSEGVTGSIARLFRDIQEDYVCLRSKKFSEEFQSGLWRDVMHRLQTGAAITETETFQRCRKWRIERDES